LGAPLTLDVRATQQLAVTHPGEVEMLCIKPASTTLLPLRRSYEPLRRYQNQFQLIGKGYGLIIFNYFMQFICHSRDYFLPENQVVSHKAAHQNKIKKTIL
jgi:hypothetical protein